MAVGVAAWVNADRRRVTSDDRESVARSSVRLAVFAIRPSAVRGLVPLVRVRRPVRVPFRVHMSPPIIRVCRSVPHPLACSAAGQSKAGQRERGGSRR